MEITPQTKLTDIMEAYPGLLDQLIRQEPKFALIKTPLGKAMIRKATVQDAVDQYHIPFDQLVSMLNEQLEKLKQS